MANMAAALRIVERDAIGVFVSVDTERDSPAVAEDYASSFGANMVGLGGSYQQITEAANNFNITYVVTKSQSNYTVQHTSSIFVVDPEGRIKEVFALNAKPNDIAAAINSVPVEGVK
jgi:protein SCO1/2